ncbi:MAG: hypothetical protein R2761_15830 [Acidimicrobiales bacterium]
MGDEDDLGGRVPPAQEAGGPPAAAGDPRRELAHRARHVHHQEHRLGHRPGLFPPGEVAGVVSVEVTDPHPAGRGVAPEVGPQRGLLVEQWSLAGPVVEDGVGLGLLSAPGGEAGQPELLEQVLLHLVHVELDLVGDVAAPALAALTLALAAGLGPEVHGVAFAHLVRLADALLTAPVEQEPPLPLALHRYPDAALGTGRDQLLVADPLPHLAGDLGSDAVVVSAAVTLAVVVEDAGVLQDGHRRCPPITG